MNQPPIIVKKRSLVLFVSATIGCTIFFVYYSIFISCVSNQCGQIELPYNLPDHLIYLATIEEIQNTAWWIPLLQNYGIGFFYYYLVIPVARLFFLTDINDISLLFNSAVYIAILATFAKLIKIFDGSNWWILILALYPPFVLFSALINKDMLLTLLLLQAFLALRNRNFIYCSILVALMALVRGQYAILIPLTYYLSCGRFQYRFFVAYVFSAFAAALIAKFGGIFLFYESDGGFSDLVFALNDRYLIGSLLLNPVRLIQYLFALMLGWKLAFADGQINVLRLITGITFFWFLILLPQLYRFFWSFRHHHFHNDERILRSICLSFIFILLLTSFVEPRYIMPLYPLLALACVASRAKKSFQYATADGIHRS